MRAREHISNVGARELVHGAFVVFMDKVRDQHHKCLRIPHLERALVSVELHRAVFGRDDIEGEDRRDHGSIAKE